MKFRGFLQSVVLIGFLLGLIAGSNRFALGQTPATPRTMDLDMRRLALTPVDANWRFQAGDDPRWSLRDFDDANWKILQPRKAWTEQGYAANQEMAWFRLRLTVPANLQAVVLQLPRIDRNYQLFADGKLIGQVGQLPPDHAIALISAQRLFTLPVPPGNGPRDIQLALRLWQARELAGVRANVLRGRVYAGDSAVVARWFAVGKAAELLGFGSEYTQDVIEIIVGAAGLLLFLLTRQRYYLWFAASMAVGAARLPIQAASEHFGWTFLNGLYGYMLLDLISLITFGFFLLGTLNERGWRIRMVLVSLGVVGELGPLLLLFAKIPLVWADSIYFVFITAAECLVLAYMVRGWRHGNIDAKLLFVPYLINVLDSALSNLGRPLVDLNVPHGDAIITQNIFLLTEPFRVNVNDVGQILSLLGLLTVLVFRFAQTSREQQRLASALQAAHDIQHRLVPVDIPSLGGLQTAIVYLAAEEVGGDFCQVLPRRDGSIFVAIGDVSGKGLQAAMLSTVAVGALRAMADEDIAPATALERLNNVLLRTENAGFITCLCMVLNEYGEVTLANAGHLSPYLNGQEVLLTGGLPLGILRDMEYEQCSFVLPAAARLTLLSDGVVEARSRDGELFGFERTSRVSQLPAADIAAKAHAHGQEDDITIITLDWRAPVQELAFA